MEFASKEAKYEARAKKKRKTTDTCVKGKDGGLGSSMWVRSPTFVSEARNLLRECLRAKKGEVKDRARRGEKRDQNFDQPLLLTHT